MPFDEVTRCTCGRCMWTHRAGYCSFLVCMPTGVTRPQGHRLYQGLKLGGGMRLFMDLCKLMPDILHIIKSKHASLSILPPKPLSDRAVKANISVSEAKPAIRSVRPPVCPSGHTCMCVSLYGASKQKTRQQLLSLSTTRHFQMATNNPRRWFILTQKAHRTKINTS